MSASRRCRWPRGSTSPVGSPTCAPTRRRSRTRPSPRRVPRHLALRAQLHHRPAASLRPQGEERQEATSHPPGRRGVPHSRRGGPLVARRRAAALRADLEAHRRLPDGRRHRRERPGASHGPGPVGLARRTEATFEARGRIINFAGFLRPTWRRGRPEAELADREVVLPRSPRATPPRPSSSRPQPRHQPRRATPRHRWSRPWRARRRAPSTYASVIKTIIDRGYV